MSYLNDPDAPQFFTGDACKAAGIDNATLKNWITRSPPAILMSEEDRAEFAERGFTDESFDRQSYERLAMGAGRSHLFTYRRVMQLALCAELVRLGFPPRKAGMVAAGFTDIGDTATGWGNEPIEVKRLPGELYYDGFTLLIARPDRETGSCLNVDFKTPITDLLFHSNQSLTTAVIVNVNHVNDRVLGSLGLDRNWSLPKRRVNPGKAN